MIKKIFEYAAYILILGIILGALFLAHSLGFNPFYSDSKDTAYNSCPAVYVRGEYGDAKEGVSALRRNCSILSRENAINMVEDCFSSTGNYRTYTKCKEEAYKSKSEIISDINNYWDE